MLSIITRTGIVISIILRANGLIKKLILPESEKDEKLAKKSIHRLVIVSSSSPMEQHIVPLVRITLSEINSLLPGSPAIRL